MSSIQRRSDGRVVQGVALRPPSLRRRGFEPHSDQLFFNFFKKYF